MTPRARGRARVRRAAVIGINNRDLKTLEVDTARTFELSAARRRPGARRRPNRGSAAATQLDELAAGRGRRRADRRGADALARHRGRLPRSSTAALSPNPPTIVAVSTKIKFCGITTLDDAERAVSAGAWAIGLIFWPRSPRRCRLERGRRDQRGASSAGPRSRACSSTRRSITSPRPPTASA